MLDLTTTELADEHVGGFLSAGPDRLTAAGKAGIPQVVSTGALDMVNFYAPESVPARFTGRTFYTHNANVTLMRTTAEENARDRRRHRAQAVGGDGARGGAAARARRVGDRQGGPAVRRSGRAAGAARRDPLGPAAASTSRSWICTSTIRQFADAAARKLLELMRRVMVQKFSTEEARMSPRFTTEFSVLSEFSVKALWRRGFDDGKD